MKPFYYDRINNGMQQPVTDLEARLALDAHAAHREVPCHQHAHGAFAEGRDPALVAGARAAAPLAVAGCDLCSRGAHRLLGAHSVVEVDLCLGFRCRRQLDVDFDADSPVIATSVLFRLCFLDLPVI